MAGLASCWSPTRESSRPDTSSGQKNRWPRQVSTVARFERVTENPTTEVVDDCVAVARQEQSDFLVGLGGGSSMDTAKGCNFLLTNGGRMEDYWGVGKALRPMLPLIAVPTTAGTGSECQSFALIAHPQTHVKMACGDPKAAARVAILDPELTLTQPAALAAATGMDAFRTPSKRPSRGGGTRSRRCFPARPFAYVHAG